VFTYFCALHHAHTVCNLGINNDVTLLFMDLYLLVFPNPDLAYVTAAAALSLLFATLFGRLFCCPSKDFHRFLVVTVAGVL